jgi:Ca2+-binding RTX toxin-like protein
MALPSARPRAEAAAHVTCSTASGAPAWQGLADFRNRSGTVARLAPQPGDGAMATINNSTAGDDQRSGPLGEANEFIGFGFGIDVLGGGNLRDIFYMTADSQTDKIRGGGGIDLIDYSAARFGLEFLLEDNSGIVRTRDWSWAQQTIAAFTDIEDITGTRFDDFISGNSVANTFDGGAGADYIDGRSGDDTLIGGFGNDTLNGSKGNDTVSYNYADTGMRVLLKMDSAGGQAHRILANGTTVLEDSLIAVENIIGSRHSDILVGNDLANRIDGGASDDRLYTLIDGVVDTMIGGAGSDTIDYTWWYSNGQHPYALIIELGGGNGSARLITENGEVPEDQLLGSRMSLEAGAPTSSTATRGRTSFPDQKGPISSSRTSTGNATSRTAAAAWIPSRSPSWLTPSSLVKRV